jgi:hypothetical protein
VTGANFYGATAAFSGTIAVAGASTASAPRLAVGRPHLSGRLLRFAVALAGAARSVQAVALSGARHVRLHRGSSSGRQMTFSGSLSRGRWTISVSLTPGSGSAALRYDFVVRVSQ